MLKIWKNSYSILALMVLVLITLVQPAFAMTDDMCSEDEKCVLCREEIKCQKCYYKCANKYGQIVSDINFIYRLNREEIRALKCYKGCWDEEVDVDIEEVEKPSASSTKSYHKKRH